MAEVNLGRRVGAFISASETEVLFLGFGTHEGEFIVPAVIDPALHAACVPSARIKLDNGDVVWGCECYWGDEEKLKSYISTLEVKETSIQAHRS